MYGVFLKTLQCFGRPIYSYIEATDSVFVGLKRVNPPIRYETALK